MKMVPYYACGICHTEYKTEEEALKCEKNHRRLDTGEATVRCRYTNRMGMPEGLPISIEVKFPDGLVGIYNLGYKGYPDRDKMHRKAIHG